MGELIELSRVSVRRGRRVVLDGVSMSVRAGACTGLIGRSGAGKSTLLRLLTRLEEPDEGVVRLGGAPLPTVPVLALRRWVQLVSQRPVLLTDRVAAELRVGRPDLSDCAVAALLARVGLPGSVADRGTDGLSGGEAQRLCLARALALNPEVLLLDEPTAALDGASAEAIDELVLDEVRHGHTVVLVSHDTTRVRRLADTVVVLEGGHVRDTGPPEQVADLGRRR